MPPKNPLSLPVGLVKGTTRRAVGAAVHPRRTARRLAGHAKGGVALGVRIAGGTARVVATETGLSVPGSSAPATRTPSAPAPVPAPESATPATKKPAAKKPVAKEPAAAKASAEERAAEPAPVGEPTESPSTPIVEPGPADQQAAREATPADLDPAGPNEAATSVVGPEPSGEAPTPAADEPTPVGDDSSPAGTSPAVQEPIAPAPEETSTPVYTSQSEPSESD